jgi:hypothetical protein
MKPTLGCATYPAVVRSMTGSLLEEGRQLGPDPPILQGQNPSHWNIQVVRSSFA